MANVICFYFICAILIKNGTRIEKLLTLRIPYFKMLIYMGRSWNNADLAKAVSSSGSYRQVLMKLGLRAAGGNYEQVKKYIKELGLNVNHFHGKLWNKGKKMNFTPRINLKNILIKNSNFQSHKLKNRLFTAELKQQKCEICGWNKQSKDGRIPLELDHINGDRHDNRIGNLRILCPNCHSLQPTHRGRNIKKVRVAKR